MELDIVSSQKVNLSNIWDMTVMQEAGLIIVSGARYGNSETLFQFSLHEGLFIEKEIKPPYEHYLHLLCVNVAGREYLALSCVDCRDIQLMDLNKQKGFSAQSGSHMIRYVMKTAFSGERVLRMCQVNENRLFVQSDNDSVLELDTSTTIFTKVRTIRTGPVSGLCYVPDPYRLLIARDGGELRAFSSGDKKVVWRDRHSGHLLCLPSHDATLVADWSKNRVTILHPGLGSKIQIIQLPAYVRGIRALFLINSQIVVASEGQQQFMMRISFFSLTKVTTEHQEKVLI